MLRTTVRLLKLYSGVTLLQRFWRWCVLLAVGAVTCSGVAAAAVTAPPGYRVAAQRQLATGVEHFKLQRRAGMTEVVNVARISKSAPYDLRAVPANGAVGRGLERTSSMCRRAGCLLAVNGDFWNPATAGVPAGAVISLGQILRAPSDNHFQLSWSPTNGIAAGRLRLHGTLVTSDLANLPITTLNARIGPEGVGAYTRAWGPITPMDGPFEIVLQKLDPPGPLSLSRTLLVRFASAHTGGGTPIPRDGLVVAARGKSASHLRAVWARALNGEIDRQGLVRIGSSPDAQESVGGSPVLLRDGTRVFEDVPSSLVRNRHPRTIVGRTRTGDVLLVTVDGRQPGHSDGMTLAEAADLMKRLGAVDALNLDGGGSSTFVVKGQVVNRPSDRAVIHGGKRKVVQVPGAGDEVLGLTERPVATSLQLVPRSPAAKTPPSRGLLQKLDTASRPSPPGPYVSDPGSDPTGTLPAIVVPTRAARGLAWPLAAAAVTLTALVLSAVSHPRLRRMRVRLEIT